MSVHIIAMCLFFIVALFYLPKIPCYGMTIKHSLLYCFRWSNLITLSKILSVILTFIIWSFLDEFINFSCMWIYFFRKLNFLFFTLFPLNTTHVLRWTLFRTQSLYQRYLWNFSTFKISTYYQRNAIFCDVDPIPFFFWECILSWCC